MIVRHTWFGLHTDFIGFTCVITVIPTCAPSTLRIDTVGYSLSGLLSPSGNCSCVGFLFLWFLVLLLISLQNHSFREIRRSRHLFYLSTLGRGWLQLVRCCGHNPFYEHVLSSRLSKPGLKMTLLRSIRLIAFVRFIWTGMERKVELALWLGPQESHDHWLSFAFVIWPTRQVGLF